VTIVDEYNGSESTELQQSSREMTRAWTSSTRRQVSSRERFTCQIQRRWKSILFWQRRI